MLPLLLEDAIVIKCKHEAGYPVLLKWSSGSLSRCFPNTATWCSSYFWVLILESTQGNASRIFFVSKSKSRCSSVTFVGLWTILKNIYEARFLRSEVGLGCRSVFTKLKIDRSVSMCHGQLRKRQLNFLSCDLLKWSVHTIQPHFQSCDLLWPIIEWSIVECSRQYRTVRVRSTGNRAQDLV